MEPRFFATPAAFRRWMKANHDRATELWVGYYRKGTGRKSITWPESVDVALCFGWIDGVRRSIDEERYTNRFTPRRPTSNWSQKNIARIQELIAEGLVEPAGLAAFERLERTRQYSFENTGVEFPPDLEKLFRADRKAWSFFQAQPPGYRRLATWWVVSAKRQETRQRRLAVLRDDSRAARRLDMFQPGQPRK